MEKKRTYLESYVDFGFDVTIEGDGQNRQWTLF